MTRKQPVDLAASVHRRLLNISLDTGDSFNLLLSRYAIERLLYRLSLSPYANQFVLKGALLFVVWQMSDHRPTRDLDLLGYGEDSAERLAAVFRAICALEVEPDGITFARHRRSRDAMSANTAIEWTESTWNQLTGCSKISPGCQHCRHYGYQPVGLWNLPCAVVPQQQQVGDQGLPQSIGPEGHSPQGQDQSEAVRVSR